MFRHIASSHMNPLKMVFFFLPQTKKYTANTYAMSITKLFVWGKICNQNQIVNFSQPHYDSHASNSKNVNTMIPKTLRIFLWLFLEDLLRFMLHVGRILQQNLQLKNLSIVLRKKLSTRSGIVYMILCYCYLINYKSFYFLFLDSFNENGRLSKCN